MSSALAGKRAVVVGGGWSGIAAAWYLRQAGAQVEIFEKQEALGGRSRSVALGDRSVTLGGKNIGKKHARVRAFAAEHGGSEWEHFGISTSQIDRGRISTIEGSRRGRTAFRMLRRARPIDVVRLIQFTRAISADPANRYLDGPAFVRATRNGDPPLSRVFGKHITTRLVRPMTIRMNGAEPDEAFLGNLGTNLSLVLDSFDQLVDGFDPVFDRVAQTGTIHHRATVTELQHHGDAVTGVTYQTTDGTTHQVQADVVVVATPATPAADLVQPIDAALAGALRLVPYHPVGVVVAEYDKDIFGDVGRALVFPEGRVISNAGAYGKEDRRTVRYTFSGRTARPLLERGPSTDDLLEAGERELGTYLSLGGAAAIGAVSETWHHGLCAYGPHHHRLSDQLAAVTERISGLAFAGDYVAGASIEACFVSAQSAVASISNLQTTTSGEPK